MVPDFTLEQWLTLAAIVVLPLIFNWFFILWPLKIWHDRQMARVQGFSKWLEENRAWLESEPEDESKSEPPSDERST